MARRQTPKLDIVDLVSRRAKDDTDKAMKLAIVRYRHLKSLSANATDVFEKAKFYEMALTCLANSAEREATGSTHGKTSAVSHE